MPRRTIQFVQGCYYHIYNRKFIQTFFPEMQQYQASVLDYLTSEITLPPNIKAYLNTLWD